MDGAANCPFSVPLEQLDKFRELYCEDLLHGKRHFLSEYANPDGFPLFIDLDFKFHRNSELSLARDLFPILRLIQAVVKDFFAYQDKPELFTFAVLTRNPRIHKNNENSYGFHVHYYNLNVTRETALTIRSVSFKTNVFCCSPQNPTKVGIFECFSFLLKFETKQKC